MRSPVVLLALTAAVLSGCGTTGTERLIVVEDSLMVVVLADLHLADARARLPGQPVGLRDSILAFHGVQADDFERAMEGLQEHPDELSNLYNSVLDRLNAARTPQ